MRTSFPLAGASSYYLPEGRYYAAPLVLKQKRQAKYVFPVVLGIGLSLAGISSLQWQKEQPLVAGTTAVPLRSDDTQVSKMIAAVDTRTTGAITPEMKSRADTKTHRIIRQGSHVTVSDEERVNRDEKSAALAAHKTNNRPLLLTSYKTDSVFRPLHERQPDLKYTARLAVPGQKEAALPSRKEASLQITPKFIPIPKHKEYPTLPVPKMLASLVTNSRADILALGYAPADMSGMKESPFDGILNEREKRIEGRFIPPIGPKDHAWAATPLPVSTFSASQQKCLAEAVYFEARGESLKGQVAVAQVVLNRVRNPAYPDTVCGVVYQNVNWLNRCQFSFACDGRRHRVTERRHWRIAQDIAKTVTAGQIWLAEVGSSTHYHAVYVRPRWAQLMDKMQKIGQHIFYRTRGGGWS